MTEQLLQTKFQIPQPPDDLLPRPALQQHLTDGLRRRLTLIAAPAGYGKTTLVAQWLPSTRAAFLALDAHDNDPPTFVSYLYHAVAQLLPGVEVRAVDMLRAAQPPALDRVWTPLLNAAAAAPEQAVLVLDDYHLVENPALHETVAYLVDHLPPQLHLLLTTRSDPPLPLARWRARGELGEIRAADLRLTVEETGRWLAATLPFSVPSEVTETLWRRIEGWPAALRLTGDVLRRCATKEEAATFVERLSGTHHYLHDYLLEEVLRAQPAGRLRFLLQTSILDRISAPLAAAVTGREDAADLLRQIRSAGLFLQPLDPAETWFRTHRLFGDLLRRRLAEDPGQDPAALHRRAAEWYDAHGERRAAMDHYLAAGAFPTAADLLERDAMGLLENGQVGHLLQWLQALPDELRRERPGLRLYHAWALLLGGKGREAALLAAELSRRSDLDRAQQGHLAAIGGYLAAMQGDVERGRRETARARRLLPPEAGSLRAIVSWIEGGMHLLSGSDAEAATAFTQAAALGRGSGNLHVAIPARRALGDLVRRQGRKRDARRSYEEARRAAEEAGLAPLAAGARRGLGDLAYEEARLDVAEAHYRSALHLSTEWGQVEVELSSRCGLARVACAREDRDRAVGQQREIERILQSGEVSSLSRALGAAALVEAWCALGEMAAAEAAAETYELAAYSMPPPLLEEVPLALARLRMGQNRPDEARELLAAVIRTARERGLDGVARRAERLGAAGGDSPPAPAGMVEPLTERELDVLALLARGMTNSAIGDKLVIAMGTVKAHTANIYGKLQVHNRTEAVARARELGLIDG